VQDRRIYLRENEHNNNQSGTEGGSIPANNTVIAHPREPLRRAGHGHIRITGQLVALSGTVCKTRPAAGCGTPSSSMFQA
jgi:hypothetical protein